jgi:hypothetical protein
MVSISSQILAPILDPPNVCSKVGKPKNPFVLFDLGNFEI